MDADLVRAARYRETFGAVQRRREGREEGGCYCAGQRSERIRAMRPLVARASGLWRTRTAHGAGNAVKADALKLCLGGLAVGVNRVQSELVCDNSDGLIHRHRLAGHAGRPHAPDSRAPDSRAGASV